ncbi:MAG: diguanylate cyclase [Bacilli bacterium]|jgi:diguanylate cyclase (GGDEF)-like protein|nr:diguanylate cyclase [Bacilli bacterium]
MTYQQFRAEYNKLYANNPEKAFSYARKLLKENKNADYKIIHSCLYLIAFGDYQKAKYSQARRKLKKVIAEYGKFRYFPTYTKAFNLLGVIEGYAGNNYLAIFYLEEATKMAIKHKMLSFLPSIYSNISMIYSDLEDNDKAGIYLEKAIKMTDKNDPNIGALYLNYSMILLQTKDYLKSREMLNICLGQYHFGAQKEYALYIKAHMLELAYALGELSKAEEIIDELPNLPLVTDTLIPYETIARVLLKMGKYDKMNQILSKIKVYQETNPQKEIFAFTYSIMAEYYRKIGDYQNAFNYLSSEKDLIQGKLKVISKDMQQSVSRQIAVARLLKENHETKILNEKLKIQSETDSLTGLYNRHAFNQNLILHASKVKNYSSFGCAIIDLDDFKAVNDTYGHLAGDQVLKTMGDILNRHYSSQAHFFRYGGDEFVALFASLSKEEIESEIKGIQKELNETLFTSQINKEITFHVTLSAGIFSSSTPLKEIIEYLNRADHALYVSKANKGKNSITSL